AFGVRSVPASLWEIYGLSQTSLSVITDRVCPRVGRTRPHIILRLTAFTSLLPQHCMENDSLIRMQNSTFFATQLLNSQATTRLSFRHGLSLPLSSDRQ